MIVKQIKAVKPRVAGSGLTVVRTPGIIDLYDGYHSPSGEPYTRLLTRAAKIVISRLALT